MSDPSFDPDRAPGPILLVLPLAALVAGVLWLRHGRGAVEGERPAPPEVEAAGLVEGWVGELPLGAGARLVARLVPLHGEAERQEFDREALAARLGRSDGEPWQLELRYSGTPERDASLLLPGLSVKDRAGVLLAPVVEAAPAPGDDAPADPLRSLLAPPAELAPGTGLTIVLWGRPPGEGARLLLGLHEVDLRAERMASDSIPRTLARLERGKR